MNKTLNKYLTKHHSVKLDANGNVIEIFKGELDNLVLDGAVLTAYKDAISAIGVPNAIEMWESLMNNAVFFDEDLVDTYNEFINFLKTPLTLDMFIAVDENGNPMEEPKLDEDPNDETGLINPIRRQKWGKALEKYREAQERIIFDGWKLVGIKETSGNPNIRIKDNCGNALNFYENRVLQGMEIINDLIGQIRLLAKIK